VAFIVIVHREGGILDSRVEAGTLAVRCHGNVPARPMPARSILRLSFATERGGLIVSKSSHLLALDHLRKSRCHVQLVKPRNADAVYDASHFTLASLRAMSNRDTGRTELVPFYARLFRKRTPPSITDLAAPASCEHGKGLRIERHGIGSEAVAWSPFVR
jgi:hypothetical protein